MARPVNILISLVVGPVLAIAGVGLRIADLMFAGLLAFGLMACFWLFQLGRPLQ